MSDSGECPKEQVLLDYAADRLVGKGRARFEAHVARCDKCRAALSWVRTHLTQPLPGEESEGLPQTGQMPETQTGEPLDENPPSLDEARFDFGLLAPAQEANSLGRLGKYEIMEVLGYGGMGVVFKAYDEQLRRTVAIKALNRALASSSTARRRFIREARAAAAINHPNVVTIHAVEEHHDLPFLVMEHISGGSLRDRLRAEKRLDPIDALRLGAQIAAGLAAAHARGVIHRDVKPGNIMLEDELVRVKITDFGLARAAVDNVELTSREMAVGTPAYMAPEQIAGEQIDARADLFALGCVMYAMLAGHSPFHGKHALDMARKVAEYEPAALDKVNERTPPFLAEIVMRLLEKDPDRRYQSAMEVADLLNQHLAVINQTPTDEMSAVLYGTGRQRRSRRSRPALAIGAAALILLAVVIVLAVLKPPGDADVPASRSPGAAPDTQLISGTITVAKSAQGRFRAINDALQRAGPDAEIQVLDGATYEENLVINDAGRWQGIKITSAGLQKPTVTAAGGTVITVTDTPRVLIHGLRIRPASPQQHAVQIGGQCPSLVLDNLSIETDQDDWSLVVLKDQAAGEPDRPICIRRCTFVAQKMGVVVQGELGAPVGHIHLENNQFSGGATHLQLNRAVRSVVATGNVFVGGIGVALGLPFQEESEKVVIANNTFLGNEYWLDLRASSPETKDVQILNNLILQSQTQTVASARYSIDEFASRWSFGGNHWEVAATSAEEGLDALAVLHPKIELLSRDPSDGKRFLRLSAQSPLATAGVGGARPEYVGAFPPEANGNPPEP